MEYAICLLVIFVGFCLIMLVYIAVLLDALNKGQDSIIRSCNNMVDLLYDIKDELKKRRKKKK